MCPAGAQREDEEAGAERHSPGYAAKAALSGLPCSLLHGPQHRLKQGELATVQLLSEARSPSGPNSEPGSDKVGQEA